MRLYMSGVVIRLPRRCVIFLLTGSGPEVGWKSDDVLKPLATDCLLYR